MTSPRRRMARADRRAQLVTTAMALFAERGVADVSMDEVAEHAGVTKPVLYDHFGSKDGLLSAVVDHVGAELLAVTTGALAGATTAEQALERGLTAYFRFVDAHAGAWSLLLQEVSPGTAAAQAVERVRQQQVDHIAALVAAHLPPSEGTRAHAYAHVVSGATERLGNVRLAGPRLSPKAATRLVMDVLWVGFGTLQDGVRWEGKS